MDMIMDMPIELQAFETSLFIDDCLGLPAFEATNTNENQVSNDVTGEKKKNWFLRVITAIGTWFKNIGIKIRDAFVNFFSKFKKKKPEEQATDTSQETQQSEDKIKSIKSKVGQIAERIRKHGSKTERLTAECSKLINANKAIVELNYRIVATTNTNLTQLFTVWQDNIKNISNNRGNMKNVETIINTNYDKMKQINSNTEVSGRMLEKLEEAKALYRKHDGNFRTMILQTEEGISVDDKILGVIRTTCNEMVKLCKEAQKTADNIKSSLESMKKCHSSKCDALLQGAYKSFDRVVKQTNETNQMTIDLMTLVKKSAVNG